MMSRNAALAACAGVVGFLMAAPALAQEAIFTPAATQPAKDRVSVRQQVWLSSYHNDPTDQDRDFYEAELRTIVAWGIRGDLSLNAEIPLLYRSGSSVDGSSNEAGVGDIPLFLKHRVWQNDTGPTDTQRIGIIGGAVIPSGDNPFSSGSVDPFVGAVYTQVAGRHGFNLAGRYTLTTGGKSDAVKPGESTSDLFRYDAAYLYRIVPESYGPDAFRSWYFTLELNGNAETNGDSELFISPGILYESPEVAFELGVQAPLYQDVNERMEREFGLVMGIRLLF